MNPHKKRIYTSQISGGFIDLSQSRKELEEINSEFNEATQVEAENSDVYHIMEFDPSMKYKPTNRPEQPTPELIKKILKESLDTKNNLELAKSSQKLINTYQNLHSNLTTKLRLSTGQIRQIEQFEESLPQATDWSVPRQDLTVGFRQNYRIDTDY